MGGGQRLTHLDEGGNVQMVDVGHKDDTERVAVAKGEVHMRPETLRLIVQEELPIDLLEPDITYGMYFDHQRMPPEWAAATAA